MSRKQVAEDPALSVCSNKKLCGVKTDADKQLLLDTLLDEDRDKAIRPDHMSI